MNMVVPQVQIADESSLYGDSAILMNLRVLRSTERRQEMTWSPDRHGRTRQRIDLRR
jgi:hypothetical protein